MSLATAPPKGPASQPSSSTDQKVADALNNLAAAIQQPEKPSKHDEPCAPGENKRSSDLCAQWKAADAAKSAAQAAWWLGGIGALIGALTLIAAVAAAIFAKKAADHTESGAKEARRAANAAEKGLRHSEKVTRAELRAYLASEKETFRIEGNVAHLDIYLRNVGQTPADKVTSDRKMFFVGGRRKPRISRAHPYHYVMGTVGPKVPIEAYNNWQLTSGKLRALRAGIARIEVHTTITFVDIFGEPWRYEHNIATNARSAQTGVVDTLKCHTGPGQPDAQGELALKPKKRSSKKK